MEQGQLTFPGEIRRFIIGGNATFTIVNGDQRFTYKVKSATRDRHANWSTNNQDKSLYFVSVLTGPSNESDFQYMGLLRQDVNGYFPFASTAKSRIRQGAPAWDLFDDAWQALDHGCYWPKRFEFWHEGQCCVCGRKLTVPESIAAGIGPECMGKI